MDVYHAMRDAYYVKQTIESVSKACRVSPTTARKYILKGDKKRGLPAIHDLFESSESTMLKKEGLTLTEARKHHLKLTNEIFDKFVSAIAEMDPKDLRPHNLINGLEKIIRLREDLLTPVDDSSPESRFDGWTEQECLDYATQGILPLRERMSIPKPRR